MIWQNTGVTCFIGLLVFPVVIGLAIGYLIVLGGVTGYRKINTRNKNNDKNKDGYQRIKVVLGEELVESSFPDTVSLNVQDGARDRSNSQPKKYYNHRLVNQNTDNGYVKTFRQQDGRESAEDTAHELNQEYRSADESDGSSLHASMEDNIDKTEDEEHETRRKEQRKTRSNRTYHSPKKLNTVELDKLLSPDSPEHGTLGKLRFALHYNALNNELQVNIIKASNLPIYDNREGVNPYVKISLLPQQFCWQRTKIIENNSNPVFNESFVISGFSKQRIDDYTLRFCVVNYHDQFKDNYADDVLGDIHFPLTALNTIDNKPTASITKWMNLQPVPVGRKLEPEELGEICVSLCYRPISGRFIVTLTKVRGLPKVALDRTDPYIKISLFCDGIRISKANTRVKRKTLNPIYNEKFNFNVTSDQISLTTVVLKVVNHYDVTHGGGGGLGQVILGYNSQGSGQEHWNAMVESPGRHVEKWHKVYKDNSI
ncbi:synaptotagmin-1-like isoform X2 [Actinia tenebrosa]|nr:synaptotagmin-1-like isoform X2 [Actinia tenebrosa]XP_031564510.1 synaptotagmin-1-like isoform X2 [Actinia tenebrosa]